MVEVSDVDFLSGERDLGFGFGAWKAGRGFWAMRRSNSGSEVSGGFERINLVVVAIGWTRGGFGEGRLGGWSFGGGSSGGFDLGDRAFGGGYTFEGGAIEGGGFGEGPLESRTAGAGALGEEAMGGNAFGSGAFADVSSFSGGCGNRADSESMFSGVDFGL